MRVARHVVPGFSSTAQTYEAFWTLNELSTKLSRTSARVGDVPSFHSLTSEFDMYDIFS